MFDTIKSKSYTLYILVFIALIITLFAIINLLVNQSLQLYTDFIMFSLTPFFKMPNNIFEVMAYILRVIAYLAIIIAFVLDCRRIVFKKKPVRNLE